MHMFAAPEHCAHSQNERSGLIYGRAAAQPCAASNAASYVIDLAAQPSTTGVVSSVAGGLPEPRVDASEKRGWQRGVAGLVHPGDPIFATKMVMMR